MICTRCGIEDFDYEMHVNRWDETGYHVELTACITLQGKKLTETRMQLDKALEIIQGLTAAGGALTESVKRVNERVGAVEVTAEMLNAVVGRMLG